VIRGLINFVVLVGFTAPACLLHRRMDRRQRRREMVDADRLLCPRAVLRRPLVHHLVWCSRSQT
jgi:hypothetical protein